MSLARRIRQAVEPADLDPPHLPPSALLIVRHMDDPKPGTLLEKGRREAGDAWQRAFRARLETLARCAIRPALDVPPDSAESVLFLDAAETLACVLEDIAFGRAESRWWWRSGFACPKGLSAERRIATLMSREIRAVPAALALLAGRGTAAIVLRWMAPGTAARLFEELESTFEMPASAAEDAGESGHPDPPWREFIAEDAVPESLAPDLRMLLATALVLASSPRHAASRRFLLYLKRWRARQGLALSGAPAAQQDVPVPAGAAQAPSATPAKGAATLAELREPQVVSVRTGLGGAFYLLNVIRWLGLPLSVGAEISAWSLLELIAQCLIVGEDGAFERDPLWQLLAELDGRTAEQQAGWDFEAPARLALPRKWLPAAEVLGVRCSARRTRFVHPLGFPVVDECGPLTPGLRRTALELVGAGRLVRAPRHRESPVAGGPGTRRLLAFLMPYLRWRLAGVGPFLSVPATVHVTRTHVDVMFPLEAASPPVRAVGLDVNPAWMPAVGRVVTFYFS